MVTQKSFYTGLFKAGVISATIFLIAVSQIAHFVTPVEKNAQELKFTVEKEMQEQFDSFEELPCSLEMKKYIECRLAKFQSNSAVDALKLMEAIKNVTWGISFICFLLSLISFILVNYREFRADET